MERSELRKKIPHGQFQIIADKAGVTAKAVSEFFSEKTKHSEKIEIAALEAVTSIAMGTSTVSYILPATGCATVASLTINPLPSATTGTMSVCAGATTILNNITSGGIWSSSITGVAIPIPIGSSASIVTGVAAGTAIITYALPSGCVATAIVTVNSLPLAITGTMLICGGATTALSETVTGGSWSSGNLSVASVGAVSGIVTGSNFAAAGTAMITYTISGGCTASIAVTVDPSPTAISGANTLCAGATISLSDGGGGSWGSSNSAIAIAGTSGIVSGVSGGVASISYTLPDGCNAVSPVTVNAAPSAIMGATGLCLATTTTLTDTTAGGSWSSSNTAIASIDPLSGIVTTGVLPGTSTISYVSFIAGCATTTVVTVNTGPQPIIGVLNVCIGDTTALGDASTGGSWSSGNTGIATVGSAGSPSAGNVYGLAAGTAVISYSVGSTGSLSGCVVTAIVTVNLSPSLALTVNALPAVPGSISGLDTLCSGFTFTLIDATTGGAWSSSNGTISITASGVISALSVGVDTISYGITNMCGTVSASTTIAVKGVAIPDSISGQATVCEGAVCQELLTI